MNKKEISILAGLVFTVVLSFCTQSVKAASDIRDSTLRLHIIANSDSAYDRQIKLMVRDEILSAEQLVFPQETDFEAATEKICHNIQPIEDRVNSFLCEKNAGYTAECSVESFYFDTRQYDGFALPQGEYTALTVRLGKAQGKNWWCVIYPALCSQSCGDIALENSDSYIKTDRITARFKIAELFEDVKNLISGPDVPLYEN